MGRPDAIDQLHARCAVFTAPAMACRLLDEAGWRDDVDLSSATLLEPCVGEGAILIEAARRLWRSAERFGFQLSPGNVVGFEIHPDTADTARLSIASALVDDGLYAEAAKALAAAWVRTEDFLKASQGRVTHVVANPPYVRWSKLPSLLADDYRTTLRRRATRGDIAVAFLDTMIDWLDERGTLVALVSDRWMFAQYGADFVADREREGWRLEVVDERPIDPFVRKVAAYSAVVRFHKNVERPRSSSPRAMAKELHAQLVARHGHLADAGCTVRVGPALGCGEAFIVSAGSLPTVEAELLRAFVDRRNLVDETAQVGARSIVSPWSRDGVLVDLADYPFFADWISPSREALAARACVRANVPWWRTIDRIGEIWSRTPKLLVPELCQKPRAYLDASDAIPAHSIYAIWSDDWPVEALRRVLNDGLLRITAEAHAPVVANGWYRLYKRFLDRVPLPAWHNLDEGARQALSVDDHDDYSSTFESLFDLRPEGCTGG